MIEKALLWNSGEWTHRGQLNRTRLSLTNIHKSKQKTVHRSLLLKTDLRFCTLTQRESERDMATTSSSSEEAPNTKKNKKERLGWIEWLRGWFYLVYEMLFQRIMASHLHNPMPLPPVNDLTCIVTGSTSGIGLEIARFTFLFCFWVRKNWALELGWVFVAWLLIKGWFWEVGVCWFCGCGCGSWERSDLSVGFVNRL